MPVDGQIQSRGSDSILHRYRRWQQLIIEIQNAALKHVARLRMPNGSG
jgi:hypothetical protein